MKEEKMGKRINENSYIKVDVNREWWPPVDRMQVVGDKREREKRVG